MQRSYGDVYRALHERHWWWRARESYVLSLVEGLGARRPLRILDIGCGDGWMWDALGPYGEVEGIEPDAELVAPDSRWRERIEIAPFPGGRERAGPYDLVLMLDVLEHIEDDRAAMAAVQRLLAPGGHLVLTVPALQVLWSEFDTVNGHFRRYAKGDLRAVLEGPGLEIETLRYYYFWPVLPLLARRLLFRSDAADDSRFVRVPPAPVNRLLRLASLADHAATRVLPAPWGSSLIAVARKPALAGARGGAA